MTTATRSRPLPPHGSQGRYRGTRTRPACRCTTCIRGNRVARARRAQERLHGQYVLINPDTVRRHVDTLIASGMNRFTIARIAGISSSTIRRICDLTTSTCSRDTAAAILAIKPGTRDALANTPIIGPARRVQALYAIGHGSTHIAAICTISAATVSAIANMQYNHVNGRVAAEIRRAYRTLSGTAGPSHTARRRATAAGWPSPIAWDDNIDDPAAIPDTDGPVELIAQPKRAKARNEEIRHLAGFGIPDHEIATRVGLQPGDVRDRIREWRKQQGVAA